MKLRQEQTLNAVRRMIRLPMWAFRAVKEMGFRRLISEYRTLGIAGFFRRAFHIFNLWSAKKEHVNAGNVKLKTVFLRGIHRFFPKPINPPALRLFVSLADSSDLSYLHELVERLDTFEFAFELEALDAVTAHQLSKSSLNGALTSIELSVSEIETSRDSCQLASEFMELKQGFLNIYLDLPKLRSMGAQWFLDGLLEDDHPRDLYESGVIGLVRRAATTNVVAILDRKSLAISNEQQSCVAGGHCELERTLTHFALNSGFAITHHLDEINASHNFDVFRIANPSQNIDNCFESAEPLSKPVSASAPSVYCYFLPQFSPNPRNNLWHGEGFTEWTNVTSAQPQFTGHYQQRRPHESIGQYSLADRKTLAKQAELARKFGIEGFIFYHYWFKGDQILNDVAESLLADPSIDINFAFCWANENWTLRWDGEESQVLLKQEYSNSDAHDFFNYLLPFLLDPRYLRIDGRPVLFIYRSDQFEELNKYQTIWQERCRAVNLQPFFIINSETRGQFNLGLDADAIVERPLSDWARGTLGQAITPEAMYSPGSLNVIPYAEVANFYINRLNVNATNNAPIVPTVLPSWDNTARYGMNAHVVHESTPHAYKKWLRAAVDCAPKLGAESKALVVINAWNEWAEGAYLEPDEKFGFAYLNATADVVGSREESPFPDHIEKVNVIFLDFKLSDETKYARDLCIDSIQKAAEFANIDLIKISDEAYLSESSSQANPLILQVRKACILPPAALQRMLDLHYQTGQSIATYPYSSYKLEDHVLDELNEINDKTETHVVLFRRQKKSTLRQTSTWTYALSTNKTPRIADVSVIVRCHNGASLRELERCIYSLRACVNVNLTILLCLQDFDEHKSINLAQIILGLPKSENFGIKIFHHVSGDTSRDLRTEMMKTGLENCSTEFCAFLDFDDLIQSSAYSEMVQHLDKTGKDFAVARVWKTTMDTEAGKIINRERAYETGNNYHDFLSSNFAPLHSILFKTKAVNLDEIKFNRDQVYMEDYHFMLQAMNLNNVSWQLAESNIYIGDYVHAVNRVNTLAVSDVKKSDILKMPRYMEDAESVRHLQLKKIREVGYLSRNSK